MLIINFDRKTNMVFHNLWDQYGLFQCPVFINTTRYIFAHDWWCIMGCLINVICFASILSHIKNILDIYSILFLFMKTTTLKFDGLITYFLIDYLAKPTIWLNHIYTSILTKESHLIQIAYVCDLLYLSFFSCTAYIR